MVIALKALNQGDHPDQTIIGHGAFCAWQIKNDKNENITIIRLLFFCASWPSLIFVPIEWLCQNSHSTLPELKLLDAKGRIVMTP
jgi:hypothetical protein